MTKKREAANRQENKPHVVVLVPGFMGFGRLGSLSYFADRVPATLRGALQVRAERPVLVGGVKTDPTGGLKSRQGLLIKGMIAIDEEVDAGAFHLVGHSTGGVDAELLTCRDPLGSSTWDEKTQHIRERIASITTIAAPHYGTCLVENVGVKWFQDPSLSGTGQAALLTASLGSMVVQRSLAVEGLEAAITDPYRTFALVRRVVVNRNLIRDLQPHTMGALRADNRPDDSLSPSIRCFVTVAPRPLESVKCDDFFERIHAITATPSQANDSARLQPFVEALRGYPQAATIYNPEVKLPSYDEASNDGVINSARQILATHEPNSDPQSALGGVVLADHGDVLGHYDKRDKLMAGTPLNHSFFRSGATFGDDQFFGLWGRVADHIAGVINPRSTP
ncbi:MAG: hypothetical protein JRH20_17270 [Deltaproteobacteria bacterium]|nr:hypothetical protein [Deltaproteobacteria bacterium]